LLIGITETLSFPQAGACGSSSTAHSGISVNRNDPDVGSSIHWAAFEPTGTVPQQLMNSGPGILQGAESFNNSGTIPDAPFVPEDSPYYNASVLVGSHVGQDAIQPADNVQQEHEHYLNGMEDADRHAVPGFDDFSNHLAPTGMQLIATSQNGPSEFTSAGLEPLASFNNDPNNFAPTGLPTFPACTSDMNNFVGFTNAPFANVAPPRNYCEWSLCMESFTRVSDLERHIQSVHLGIKWHCDWFDCGNNRGNGYCRLEKLRRHQKEKHGFSWV
jgi:hypothetical protein